MERALDPSPFGGRAAEAAGYVKWARGRGALVGKVVRVCGLIYFPHPHQARFTRQGLTGARRGAGGRRGGRGGPGAAAGRGKKESPPSSEDPALQSERSSELESSSLLLSPLGSQESELLMAREGANGDDPLSSPRPSSYSSPFGKEPEGAAVGDDARPASADRVAPAPPPGIGSPGIDEDAALTSYSRWPGVSLLGALRRLTHTELLGAASSSWRCAACGASQGATKRLSLAKLPPVLVLHAKRFEHSGGWW